MQSFYKVANYVLEQGMTEEAFDALCSLCYDLAFAEKGTIKGGWSAVDDLINRTKRVHYPHGYRIEFRTGGRFEI